MTNEKVIEMAEANDWKRGEPGVTGEARWIPPNGNGLCYIGAVKYAMEEKELKDKLKQMSTNEVKQGLRQCFADMGIRRFRKKI